MEIFKDFDMQRLLLVLCIAGISIVGNAQNTNKRHKDFEEFRKTISDDFENFRMKITQDFIEFVRYPWKEFEAVAPVPEPNEEPAPPPIVPIGRDSIAPIYNNKINIDSVITPLPVVPQPAPIEPIEEVPVLEENYITFQFFGTPCKVRYEKVANYHIRKVCESAIVDALTILATEKTDNLIYDCLETRERLQLCDWAYLLFLKQMSETIYGEGTDEATLLMAYIYLQSGYKMRFAHNGNKLYMLYGSDHIIFREPSYEIEGNNYYCLDELPENLMISCASFPEEKNLSLIIGQQPKLSEQLSDIRNISSDRYPSFKFDTNVNKNIIEFFSSYPSSYYNGNIMTKWAQYANTPISDYVRNTLYKKIKAKIVDLSEIDAVNIILNWIQTGLIYEYDDKVWGYDRSFFSEESLFYPYCDCEDRSILFTRIVRDVLNLQCILIYYPGHLAAAVCFKESVDGDYIMLNENRYIVCDPTYIGAPVGNTMCGMDNSTAKVIMLK